MNSCVHSLCLQTHIFSLQIHYLSYLTRLFFLSVSTVVGFPKLVNIPNFMNGFLFKPSVRAISILSIPPGGTQIVSILDMADQDKHNTFLFLDVDRSSISNNIG